ncbi:hypothetical protein ACJX0J_022361, partial [Zea mays]
VPILSPFMVVEMVVLLNIWHYRTTNNSCFMVAILMHVSVCISFSIENILPSVLKCQDFLAVLVDRAVLIVPLGGKIL